MKSIVLVYRLKHVSIAINEKVKWEKIIKQIRKEASVKAEVKAQY